MTDAPHRPSRSRFAGSATKLAIRLSAIAIVLAAVAYWGADWLQHRANHVFENDARIAADMIAISSRVNGWVVERTVSQGDRIKTGTVLIRMDARDALQKLEELKARIEEIKAEQGMTRAEISFIESQTQHRIDAQKHRVRAGRAAVEAAKAQVELFSSEYRRAKSLASRKIVSEQRLDTAKAGLRNSRERQSQEIAELAARRALLSEAVSARKQVTVLLRRLDRMRAGERRVAAQVKQQQLDIDDRTISSPIAGAVDQTFVEAGEFVRAGQRLALIHDPRKIWIEANIRETDLRHVQIGAAVNVRIDAYPETPVRGTVVRIGDAATSQFALLPNPNPSGNFTKISQRIPIRIGFDRNGVALAPGMMVEIEIVIPPRSESR